MTGHHLTENAGGEISAFLAVVALFCLLAGLYVFLVAITHRTHHPLRPWLSFFAMLIVGWSLTLFLGQLPIPYADRLYFFRKGAPFWCLIGASILAIIRSLGTRKPPYLWLVIGLAGGIIGITTEQIYFVGVKPAWFGHAVIPSIWHTPLVVAIIFFPFLQGLYELNQISNVQQAQAKRNYKLTLHYLILLGFIGLIFDAILPIFGYWLFNESTLIVATIGSLIFLRLLMEAESRSASLAIIADELFRDMKEGVLLLDNQGYITRSNPASQAILCKTSAQLENKYIKEILPGFALDTLYHSHPFALPSPLEKQRYLCLDFSRHQELNGSAGYMLRLEDITELREAREALGRSREDLEVLVSQRSVALARAEHLIRKQEDFLRSLLDNIPFPVWSKDKDGRITLQNTRHREKFGMLLGVCQILSTAEENALSGMVIEEENCNNNSPEETWERCVYAPIRSVNGISGILGICIDISDQKRAERTRLEFQGRLAQSLKMEAIGSLAGGIAHDFNNILGALRGFVELAQEGIDKDHQSQVFLKEALVSTDRARKLVEQLLSFARGERKRTGTIDAGPLLQEILTWIRSTLPPHIHLQSRIEPGTYPVSLESTDLHRILTNLTSNSVHAMKSLGGLLEVNIRHCTLEDIRALHLQVVDFGYGISAEHISRIFDPFYTTKGPKEGMGLGLSVVHNLVRLGGGTIEVCSRAGEGTRFDIKIPLTTWEKQRTLASPSLNGLICHCLLSQRSTGILIGDLLERVGAEVWEHDSPQALLDSVKKIPQCILCIDIAAMGKWPERILAATFGGLENRILILTQNEDNQTKIPSEIKSAGLPINPDQFYSQLRAIRINLEGELN